MNAVRSFGFIRCNLDSQRSISLKDTLQRVDDTAP